MEKGGAVFFFPKLNMLFPEWSGFNEIRQQVGIFRDICEKTVAEHKATFSDEYSRDFIDAFLKQIKSTVDPNSAFYKHFGGNSPMIGFIRSPKLKTMI